MAQTIKTFIPEKAQERRVWLIIGSRNTGKSVLLKDLLYRTQKKTDFIMAMTSTISSANTFKSFMPPELVYTDGYNFEIADEFLKVSSELAARGKVRNMTLCLDDVMFDPKVMKSKTQNNLHLNGRHYNTSIFNTTQYTMLVPANIRSNVDYVFALKDTTRSNRKRLYEHFFGVFSSFSEFEKVFNKCTDNFGALVLDRTVSSSKMFDLISHYRACYSVPQFRIGKAVYYELCKKKPKPKKAELSTNGD